MSRPVVETTPAPAATRVLTYAEALNEALREEMRRDPRVFVMGEDVAVWGGGGVFGVTRGRVEEFGPQRVRDTPISEEAIAALAVGDENRVVFLEHKILYNAKGPVPAGDVAIPMGVADCKRAGRDATFVGVHTMVHKALAAAETLAAEGIDLEVIDPRTLVPFDLDAVVASVRKTGRLVVGHEAYERCGIGAEIIAQ